MVCSLRFLPFFKQLVLLSCYLLLGGLSLSLRADDIEYRFERAWPQREYSWHFFSPVEGIAIAPDGSVYVADWLNDRIQQFTADGAYVRSLAAAVLAMGSFMVIQVSLSHRTVVST